MKKGNVAAHDISCEDKNSVKKMDKKLVQEGLAEMDRALQQLNAKQKEKRVFLFRR